MGIIEKMRLDGKKGFVTGAARGIGKCTATAFAEAGAEKGQRKNWQRKREEKSLQSKQIVQKKKKLTQW